jgi:hypothetical protein
VDHAVYTLQRTGDRRGIAHIANLQLDIGARKLRSGLLAVDLLDKAVKDSDTVPTREKRPGEVSTDEAGAAGDENTFRQLGASVESCGRRCGDTA